MTTSERKKMDMRANCRTAAFRRGSGTGVSKRIAGPRGFSEVRYFLGRRYSHDMFVVLILIAGLNVLDYLFTIMILDGGGTELNPIVQSAITAWGESFWIWKFLLVSVCLVLLCIHSHFRFVKPAIFGIGFIYVALIVYQIVLLQGIMVS